MCVIIIKQEGKRVPERILKRASIINPHGMGVVFLDTFEVSYHKSKQWRVLDTDRPFIAHFRYATIGKVGLENTHPFRCGNNENEFLMMNGTIPNMGNKKVCDSRVLAMSMGDIPRTKWRDKLESHGNVRFVTINTKKRSYEVYNKHLWTIRDGIWYSKGNVAADIPVAVYGTLKKGHNNYFSYLTSSEFVGSGKTKSKYPLVIEGLPYLLQNKGVGHNVRVDVFSVTDDTFNALDKLEGHPNWYFRRRVKIVLDSGAETEAWVYFNKRELKKSDKLHETYTQNYSRGAGYQRHSYDFNKPTWTPSYRQLSFDSIEDAMEHDSEIDMMDEGDECCLKSEVPFCTSCYKDLQHDGHAGYYCEGCNEWYSEEDAKRFVF